MRLGVLRPAKRPHSHYQSFSQPCNGTVTCACDQCDVVQWTPAPRLVGVEPNPGPPKSKTNLRGALKSTAVKAAKTAVKQVVGHSKSAILKSVKKQGKEPSLARRMLRGGASTLGGFVGLAGPAAAASDFLSDILGFGSYHVKQNSIATSSEQIPEFKSDREGRLILEHRECLGDVLGSTSFATPFSGLINPTNPTMFPWLSNIARNYEQYRFKGLVFMFKSTSANALNSTNTALGTVLMTTQYDAANLLLTDKVSMEAYEFTTSNPPSKSAIHPVECKPSLDILKSRYVREPLASLNTTPQSNTVAFTNVVGATNNLGAAGTNITDVGLFQLSTVGMQAQSIIGELWVSYEIEFTKPRPLMQGTGTLRAQWSSVSASAPQTSTFNTCEGMKLVTSKSTIVPGQRGFPQLESNGRYISFEGCLPGSVFEVTLVGASTGAVPWPTGALGPFNPSGLVGVPYVQISPSGIGSASFYTSTANSIYATVRVQIPPLNPGAITYPSLDSQTISAGLNVVTLDLLITQVPGNSAVPMAVSLSSERERFQAMLAEFREEKQVSDKPEWPMPPYGQPVSPTGQPVDQNTKVALDVNLVVVEETETKVPSKG